MCFGLSLKEKQSLCRFIVHPQETLGRRCSHRLRENNHRMPESDDQILPTKQKENIMGGVCTAVQVYITNIGGTLESSTFGDRKSAEVMQYCSQVLADFLGLFTLFLAPAFRPYCNLSSCFSSSPNRKNVERAWTSFSTVGVIPNLPEIMRMNE